MFIIAMIQYYSLDWSLGLSLGWAAMASYFWSGPVFLMYFFIFMAGRFLLKAAGILNAVVLVLLSILLSCAVGYTWSLGDFRTYQKALQDGIEVVFQKPHWDGFQFTTGLIFGIAYALFYYYRIEPERRG
jgi:hypothetical protein